jgi:hypothetical protein
MKKRLQASNAVRSIHENGVLLVFPINNRELPLSLWSEFFPRTKMVWDWNDDAAGPVHEMWSLMKRLSDCRDVVYSKWYQGRATFFSRELFEAMLCLRCLRADARRGLSFTARALFEVLENNSPLSTRRLKELTDLQGKLHEAEYSRAMKDLFTRLLIVGFGEVDDGAFPSLAVGSTELLFDDLWRNAEDMPDRKAQSTVDRLMPQASHFRRFFDKTDTRH